MEYPSHEYILALYLYACIMIKLFKLSNCLNAIVTNYVSSLKDILIAKLSGECMNKECQYLHVDPESRVRHCPWYDRGFCKHGMYTHIMYCFSKSEEQKRWKMFSHRLKHL